MATAPLPAPARHRVGSVPRVASAAVDRTPKGRPRKRAPKTIEHVPELPPFEPPSVESLQWLARPLRTYFAPKVFGLEHVHPRKPALYVGNHSIYGLIDLSLFGAELYQQKGIYLRGLADRGHFYVPGWADLLTKLGAVIGTRETCAQLMEHKEHIVVFPGGGREVARRKGEQYKLIWKARTGFVRLAIRYGYPIVPFAQVGADDAFDILVDANDVMRSPFGRLLKTTGIADQFLRGGETIFPLARGLGLTGLPRPERFYYSVLPPIETRQYSGGEDDDEIIYDLRDRVRDAIRDEIARLRAYRKTDREISFVRRLINRFG
jgi:1-acyl-sn-glycerol-3-phosphate acyltransferase